MHSLSIRISENHRLYQIEVSCVKEPSRIVLLFSTGIPAPGRCKATKEATVVILDMAAVIHIIKPQRARIFGEYTQMQLLPYMQSQMTDNTSRVDAIWNTHQEASLKSQTHAKRGETSSRRTRVSAKIPIPKAEVHQR